MVVDDEDAAHDIPPINAGVRVGFSLARCSGISIRITVPLDRPAPTSQVPPSERTRSVIEVRPKPRGVDGAIPLPSSPRVRLSLAGAFLPARRGASSSIKAIERLPALP